MERVKGGQGRVSAKKRMISRKEIGPQGTEEFAIVAKFRSKQ
jgi:hypothetical protein